MQQRSCSGSHCYALRTPPPPSFSLPWFPFWFLCKLIGPPSSWGHPVSNPPLSASSAPRGSPRPDCVYSSALPALSCCVFPSWHLGLIAPSQQWDSALFIQLPQENESKPESGRRRVLENVLESPKSDTSNSTSQGTLSPGESSCRPYWAGSIQSMFLRIVNISMREMTLVTSAITFQEPSLQGCYPRCSTSC